MLGANQKINDLLEKIKHDAEEVLITQASEHRDLEEKLFDFSIKAFKVDNFSDLNSIDELLASVLNFIEYSLKHIEKVYIQLREWYATHTPEAPHIMHIPLHPASALAIHSEALRKLGAEFDSFEEYDNFLKKVRVQMDVCLNSKHLLLEQRSFLENSDISYIYYQLPAAEKPILAKTLHDLRPAIENILLNFQSSQEHMPGNLYVDGGFIGGAFSETNNSALELYRVKKIITLIKEGMSIEHINLYQKVFESQMRLNKMLSKAIQEFGLDSFQAQLYSAQAEAGRLAKKYIEEVHQVTQSKLMLDIEQASTWFINGKPSLNHPLHRDNSENFLTEIRSDFLETKNIKKITSLYESKEAKYQKALRKVSNKQKLIERFINFDRNSTIDESELIRVLTLLHRGKGYLTANIGSEAVKEALLNIGISSSYLEELGKLSYKTAGADLQISFDKVATAFLKLSPDLESTKLKHLLAICLNSKDQPLIKETRLCAKSPEKYQEKSLKVNAEFLLKLLETESKENSVTKAFHEYFNEQENNTEINNLIEFFIKYEQEFGINSELVKLREIIVKVYFLANKLNSFTLYQETTKKKFFYHDEFFRLASKPKEQAEAFQKYRYLVWAQKLTENFTKADDSLIDLLIRNKLNFKTCLLSLNYLSNLNSSRYQLIQSLSAFNGEEANKHLHEIENSFFENFKNESNIFAILARGGSINDIQAMDNLCSVIQTLYLNIMFCKNKESVSTENSGAHRLARQQYYSMWGLRSGLYHSLNRLKEKDVYFLKEQSQKLLQISEQLQKIVQETNHDRWAGYIFDNLDYQLLEQKWFQKISLINDFLRGSAETKEALDLLGVCDKGFQFDKIKTERLLSDFKAEFIKSSGNITNNRFQQLYRVICFRFDELKQNRDPFFQILIFNLILNSKKNYYESLKTKLSRYSEKQRSVFSELESFLSIISSKLSEIAIKSSLSTAKSDTSAFLHTLNHKIKALEENPDLETKNDILAYLNSTLIIFT